MTAIKLPDALVKALHDHDVHNIEDIEKFVSQATWEKLQEDDDDRQLTDAEIELLQGRFAQAERGEVYSLEEFGTMMKANKAKILAEISTNK
jgi:DNA-binding MltR family transcriptional regulator